jgi:hypothetical protein
MGNQLGKSVKDPMKKIIEKQNIKLRPRTLGINAKTISWAEHCEEKHLIENFTTIIEDKAFVTTPAPGTVMVPVLENFGDHGNAFIVMLDIETGNEYQRKNVRHIDMLTWAMDEEETEDAPEPDQEQTQKDDIQ